MDPLESLPPLGDLIKMESDYRYTRCAAEIFVDAPDPVDGNVPVSLLGYPVAVTNVDEAPVGGTTTQSAVMVAALAEASCNGLILLQKRNQSTATADVGEFPVLIKGPAIVNRAALPTVDYAGANLDIDALVAALAVRGIRVIDEHAEQNVQTT